MKKIAVLTWSFHTKEMEEMLDETYSVAKEIWLEIIEEVRVPWSMEKPLALKRLFEKKEIEWVVVLGIIENWETQHWLVMGHTVYQALINLQLDYNKPIGLWILWPGILPNQIESRIRPYSKAAVLALHEMLK